MRLANDTDAIRAAAEIERTCALLAATVAKALTKMGEQTGGFSSRASGANADGGSTGIRVGADDYGPAEQIAATTVEIRALTGAPDRAVTDRADLLNILGQVVDLTRDAARIATTYTNRRLTTADVTAARRALTDDVWCLNCITHGVTSPRKGDKQQHCNWCYAFHAEHGVWPPKPLVDLHSQGRRLHQRDIDRALAGARQIKGRKSKGSSGGFAAR